MCVCVSVYKCMCPSLEWMGGLCLVVCAFLRVTVYIPVRVVVGCV